MRRQRKLQPDHLAQHRRMPGRAQRDLPRRDPAATRLDRGHPAIACRQAGDLAVLDEIDAHRGRRTRETPGHVVMLRDARARLVGRAQHRVPDVRRDVDDRADLLDLLGFQPFGVDPVEAVGVDPAHAVADVLQAVREVDHAALAEQDRIAEVFLEPLPQLQRVLVNAGTLVPQVVRADDRGVAGHVPARQPALLQHGDVRDAVDFGQVVRGRQAVPAPADDHDVVARLRIRVVPQEVGVLRQLGAGSAGHACLRWSTSDISIVDVG